MDALPLAYLVKNTYQKLQHLEKFEDAKATTTSGTSTPAPIDTSVQPSNPSIINAVKDNKTTNGASMIGLIFYLIFAILFGGYSAYLSWFANSMINWQSGWKIFFSFCAFFAGFSYLMTYLIHKLDLLNYIRRSNGEVI